MSMSLSWPHPRSGSLPTLLLKRNLCAFLLLKSGELSPFTCPSSLQTEQPYWIDFWNLWVTPKWLSPPPPESQGPLIRKKKKKVPLPLVKRADEMLSQPSSGDFPGTEGNEQGGPLCAVEADPVNKPGSSASPLASACLPKEGNDH